MPTAAYLRPAHVVAAGHLLQGGVKLGSEITINGRKYLAGDEVPWTSVFPSSCFMAYASDSPAEFCFYLHGGFGILIYLVFYLGIVGRGDVTTSGTARRS